MSSTPPPASRRLRPVVTVRRAQSERRYLSPWQQASSSSAPPQGLASAHARFWQPILYPPQVVPPPPLPPSGFPHPLPPTSGWARMERIEHRIDHHHHARRTALIPPALPRSHHPHMIGKSQLVLNGDLLWGSIRQHHPHVPYMPPAQLPPMALGSPPPLMAVAPVIIPPGNLQDKLAQDRLTAFLSGETTAYRPRSILSCPESPLYESLVSTFSALDDEITFPDTDVDHEYQQIPSLDTLPRKPQNNQEPAKDVATPSSSRNQTDITHEAQTEHQAANGVKIYTLDVRPEKNTSREKDVVVVAESQVCNCQSSRSSDPGSGVPSPVSRKIDSSSQTVSPSSEFHRTAVYITNNGTSSPAETMSSLSSDSDTYQDIDRPPTVIHLPSSSKGSVERSSSFYKNEENSNMSPAGIKQSSSFSSQDKHAASPRVKPNSSSTSSTVNSKPNYAVRSNSHSDPPRIQKKSSTKTPETAYLPLTIELPETKDNPRKSDLSNVRNNSNHIMSSNAPHIITTLDPPIRSKNLPDWTNSNDIPPLIVNFDSEHSESEDDDDLVMETDSSSTTQDDSTSLYVTGGDTTSLYSSVAELYSVIPADPDSLVYVYRAVPHHRSNKNNNTQGLHHSTIDYRMPAFILSRGNDCSSDSSCSSSSEVSWSDTVSFVEPTYRPSNLSVGSRGHLKIDYSWSWDSLDDFVRTNSPPRGGLAEDRMISPGRSIYSNRSPQGRPVMERKSSRGPHPLPVASPSSIINLGVSLTPWEKHSDPVAG